MPARRALEVAVVGGLEHERDPADAALDRHELQVGEAGEHAAREQVGALQAVLQEQLDATCTRRCAAVP